LGTENGLAIYDSASGAVIEISEAAEAPLGDYIWTPYTWSPTGSRVAFWFPDGKRLLAFGSISETYEEALFVINLP
jgi:hypothetical protein